MKELCNRVAEEVGSTPEGVETMLKSIKKQVKTMVLDDGLTIELLGFLTFSPDDQEERIVRNPRTKEHVIQPKTLYIHVKRSSTMKKEL